MCVRVRACVSKKKRICNKLFLISARIEQENVNDINVCLWRGVGGGGVRACVRTCVYEKKSICQKLLLCLIVKRHSNPPHPHPPPLQTNKQGTRRSTAQGVPAQCTHQQPLFTVAPNNCNILSDRSECIKFSTDTCTRFKLS